VEKECLAIVWAFKNFDHYLLGHNILVRSDHKPLKYLGSCSTKNERIKRWASNLAQYDFTIEHISGQHNSAADFLSRLEPEDMKTAAITRSKTKPKDEMQPEIRIPLTTENVEEEPLDNQPDHAELTSAENIAEEQRKDPLIQKILQQLDSGEVNKGELCRFFRSGDVLVRLWRIRGMQESALQIVVPKTLVPYVLHQNHGCNIAAHFGIAKVTDRILRKYWWSTMITDIKNWIKSCEICHLTKKEKTPKVPLQPIPVSQPWEIVSVDCLTIKPSTSGNTNIVVFCDLFSKWTEAFAVPDITAETIANLFINNIVLRHGEPLRLLSDQGTNFMSELIDEVCKLLKTKKINTTSYHPQCNGQVERANKTILEQLKRLAKDDPHDWEKYLPFALAAYRFWPHETTRASPYQLLYGHEPRLGVDNLFVKKRYYDRKTKEKNYQVGDLVALECQPKFKLDKYYKGPFQVVSPPTETTVKISNPFDDTKIYNVSLSRVKPWFSADIRDKFVLSK